MRKNVWIKLIAFVLIVIGIVLELSIGNMISARNYDLNYFAAGDYACGVFAAGKFAIGIFSIGIFSIGIFSIGIFNIGIYSIGIFVLAYRKRLPDTFQNFIKSNSSNFKSLLLILFFISSILSISAQDKSKFKLSGGFGGPFSSVSSLNVNPTLSFGGGGAAVFNNGIFVGGFGLETSDLITAKSKIDDYKLKVEYGGFWLGYLKNIGKQYRVSGSLKTGIGEALLVNNKQKLLYYNNLIVFSPEISISKRLCYFISIELGLFYNLFTGINLHGHCNNDFSSLGTSLMFKFGGGYF